jgi:non-ribosomal peptide synthetase component F
MVQSPEGRAHRAYWLGKLSNLSSAFELPTDRNRPEVETFRGAAERFVLPGDIAAGVSQLALQTGTTPYAVLLSIFKLLLWRRSGREDLLAFTSVAARTATRYENLIGLIANLVFIRSRIPAKGTFEQFLAQVHRTIGEALDHQDYPHAALLKDLGIRNEFSRHPLTTVGFSMERPSSRVTQSIAKLMYGEGDTLIQIAGYEARSITLPRNRAICDLNMIVDVFEDRVVGILDYNVDLFEAQTIRDMAKEYQVLLQSVLAKPSFSLAQLSKLSTGL